MSFKIKKRKILHVSFAIALVYCVQFSINTLISFTQFSKKWIASIRSGESMKIAAKKGFLAIKESEYRRSNVFVHKVSAASPTCTITAPIAGSVLGASVAISADAAGAGPISVQFLLDGVNLGLSDSSSPYGLVWNTATSANAVHTLSCVTTNKYGETTTGAPVLITTSNSIIDQTSLPTDTSQQTTIIQTQIIIQEEDKKKIEPKPNRVIKQNYSKVKRGGVLIQSGKRFSKNAFVELYFSRRDLSFYPPVRVKTSSKGAFSVNYVANKAIGKYKWYAVDLKSGRKTGLLRYEITAGTTKKQASSKATTKTS